MTGPALFALPPGANFSVELAAGIVERHGSANPEGLARVEVIVNTRRMQRALREAFAARGPLLLPRVRIVTDIGRAAILPGAGVPVSALRRKLELAILIRKLIESQPDLAPSSAVFDLAESLAALSDEMQGEGVGPERLAALDLSAHSEYWERSLRFLGVVQGYLDATRGRTLDTEARQRLAVETLARKWAEHPPGHPVILAGSTGSRGSTAILMDAVARLPGGAVVLPGFDFDMPQGIWDRVIEGEGAEDHPQHRFAALVARLGLRAGDVRPWTGPGAGSPRNRLVSLALRPAPVTDQWMTEGAALADIAEATAGITLVEAPSQRHEALTIALRLRQAVEEGRRAALVTPDRMLTRRVAASLDRWGIEPDDSAGRPLALMPPGRLLRHVAELMTKRCEAEDLLVLLKHPLANIGGETRGPHLLWTRELELWIRKKSVPFPGADDLAAFAEAGQDPARAAWARWAAGFTGDLADGRASSLSDHAAAHLALAGSLVAGPGGEGAHKLWTHAAGREARAVMDRIAAEGTIGAVFTAQEYRDLVTSELNAASVREVDAPWRDVLILGTLEARVQGVDLLILGSLNDGIWPEAPPADPWLNRDLRRKAGLLLPDRRIGLAAHDFQQAIAAREVVLTRAVRDAEAQTVPSRWLNRLTNLLGGLTRNGGTDALDGMRDRGARLLRLAEALERPERNLDPAPRPSPRPPVEVRPKRLSVTRVERLIRDPYAIYAESVLGLRELDPLRIAPDAPLRGTLVHRVFDRFLRTGWSDDPAVARATLVSIAREVMEEEMPWPATRTFWIAQVERVADWFIENEIARQNERPETVTERKGHLALDDLGFLLTAEADRIDRLQDGRYRIYDYKTGKPPSPKQMAAFDKQLLLEAAIAEAGGFEGLDPATVASVTYIGLGSSPEERALDLPGAYEDVALDAGSTLSGLRRLIAAYGARGGGYTSRRAMEKLGYSYAYDHLARHGEWNDSDDPSPEDVG